MFRCTWKTNVHDVGLAVTKMMGVCQTLMTSHIGDLDAGVTTDRASLGSGRSLVSNLPRQGPIAAMATQVPPIACFRAEPCWRLEQKHKYSQTRLPPRLLGVKVTKPDFNYIKTG